MDMPSNQLLSILIAEPSFIGPNQAPTGIVKKPTDEVVLIDEMGIKGDFQADRRVHGGLDKAIYQFPSETYQTLSEALPHLAEKFSQPCVGENFSSKGINDHNTYIGDIYRVGEVLLQVSQPRIPCWKLNQHTGSAHMMNLLISLNATGWYYRVLEAGKAQAGDSFELVERVQTDFTVADIWDRWLTLREQGQTYSAPIEIKGLSLQWSFDWG